MKITVSIPDGELDLAESYLAQVGEAITDLSKMMVDWKPTGGRFAMEFPTNRAALVAGWWKVEA